MLTKIIYSIIAISFLVLLVFVIGGFIRDIRKHNKKMRKLDEWREFNEQLVSYSQEITDPHIKQKFIEECIDKLLSVTNKIPTYDSGEYWEPILVDIEQEKQKVCQKWGQYIPSLLQEVRNQKLNKLI